ncbi:hypothetical protein G9P44_004179 [Scheffersomyces stipitis]|nr:hypothetical protein G9P44_004179 [Scheffersomyces stipitis]
MSATPSPTKRSVLSPKPSNISTPSRKNGTPIFVSSKLSPVKAIPSRLTPSPKKPKLNFTIWEDKAQPQQPEISEDYIFSNKQNHNDQENILQPKKNPAVTVNRRSPTREPLGNLNIHDFPGHVTYGSATSLQLTELYQPTHYNNEFKSLHKFSNIPSFLTPTRKNNSNMEKYLVKSSSAVYTEDDEIDLELDDAEMTLVKKQLTQNSTRKHRRSYSVGKNDSKSGLIRRNNFTILSN